MELREMTIDQIEARKLEIVNSLETINEEEELRKLNDEMDSLIAEVETRAKEEAQRQEIRSKVANGEGKTIIKIEKDENKMEEVRNSKAYLNAYANYIKTGKDAECRALLTENATDGVVPVPELVDDIIRTAWDNDELASLVKKSYIKGNLKVGFEISGTDAEVHTEGGEDIDEETLVLGIKSLVPESLKKWITISDEALDLTGEAFLDYIYREIAHKIAKLGADTIVADIVASPTSSTATAPAVPDLSYTVGIDTITRAIAKLTDEAKNPVVICSKGTWAALVSLQKQQKYAQDVFDGLKVVYNSTLPDYASADAADVYLIVGDLGNGYQFNFPNGNDIKFTFDPYSLSEKDLVKIVGRQFVGHGVVAPNHFVNVKKPAQQGS